MGLGKTYSTQYLLDSNNSSGVAGQVLSTTSTGIDWVDANTVPGTGLWLANGNDIYNSNSGNVGIGITNPSVKLHVDGTTIFDTNTGSQPVYITRSGATDQALKIYVDDAAAIFESIQDETADNYGAFQFVMDAGVTEPYFDVRKGAALANTLFRVDGNGNVGIGTTSPTYKLQIGNAGALADSIRIGSYDAVKNTRQYIGYTRQDTGLFETSTSGNTPSSVLPGVSGIRIVNTEGSVLSTKADQSIQLLTHIYNGSSRVALHANYDGNVGIGTTTPDAKLEVIGTAATYTNASTVLME
jgi:hypothetical protein